MRENHRQSKPLSTPAIGLPPSVSSSRTGPATGSHGHEASLRQTNAGVKAEKAFTKRGFGRTPDPTRGRDIDKLRDSNGRAEHPGGITAGLQKRKASTAAIG